VACYAIHYVFNLLGPCHLRPPALHLLPLNPNTSLELAGFRVQYASPS